MWKQHGKDLPSIEPKHHRTAEAEQFRALRPLMQRELEYKRLRTGEIIGEGHFSVCYDGTYTAPDGTVRHVVVKTFKPNADLFPEQLNEAKMLLQTEGHANFLNLVGYLYGDGHSEVPLDELWVVTEKATYGSLSDWFIRNQKGARSQLVNPSCTSYVAGELLTAVAHLHEDLDTLHRDIALRNLLFNGEGRVLLSDLGLARTDEQGAAYYAQHSATPLLQAPEFDIARRSSRATDLWMVGATLMELLLSRSLLLDEAKDQKRIELLLKPFVPMLHPALAKLIPKLLRAVPGDRPTASQALAELKECYSALLPSPCLPALAGGEYRDIRPVQQSTPQMASSKAKDFKYVDDFDADDVSNWIASIGENFAEASRLSKVEGLNGHGLVRAMADPDPFLIELGITKILQRNAFVGAFAKLSMREKSQ